MPRVRIVTDSTSDIPPKLAAENEIEVLPLTVSIDHKEYRDGVDISPGEFYSLQATCKELPKTTQITLAQFRECFESLVRDGFHVIAIHLSSGLSGTVAAASLAARQVQEDRISVVDSKLISWGQTFLALEAAKLARAGLAVSEILARIHELRNHIEVVFTVSTLEYLRKGGRIGRVSAAIGSLLNIKPLIRVDDGIYTSFGKVRTLSQAIEQFVAFTHKKVGNAGLQLAIGHGCAPEAALKLRDAALRTLRPTGDVPVFEVGPAIGVHTGPGTLGMAFYSIQS